MLFLTILLSSTVLAYSVIYGGQIIKPVNGSLFRGMHFIDSWLFVLPIFVAGLIVLGFRPLDAGFDTPRYVSAYLAIGDFFSAREVGQSYYGNTEFLWWPIQSLFKSFLSARGWLVFNYILVFFLVFWSYIHLCRRYFVSPFLFALVFFTYYFVYTGNAVRQALALPFALLAFLWWFDRRYASAAIMIFLSIGLHWSSIIFIFTPLLKAKIFHKRVVLLSFPLLMLIFSLVLGEVAKVLIEFIGFKELSMKYDLYLGGGRESHIGEIWKQFNFWLCVTVSFLFLFFCPISKGTSPVLHLYVMFFLGLIMFSISMSDISERFFPAIFLVMPAIVVLLVRRLKVNSGVLGAFLVFGFLGLWLLILTTESAQHTLGYKFF
ncbi:EpsG family protein [Marinobacter lipolyticus]|uniref:EpsG family protein n=1 Tax=Marinobacter lipolyticus TaxID=209639 RepID=UPI003A95D839